MYAICYFSLVTFNILSLSLIFVSLITMWLCVFLRFILPGTFCASWIELTTSFPMFGKFSSIFSLNIFSGPFSLSSPSGTPIIQMLVHLMLSQRSLRLSFLFILFFFFFPALCYVAVISTILAWRIPWTDEPGRLQSMGSQESDMTYQLNHRVGA